MSAIIAAPITFAIMTSAVAASVAVAFGLEWLCLRSLMAFMPARQIPERPAMFTPQSKQDCQVSRRKKRDASKGGERR